MKWLIGLIAGSLILSGCATGAGSGGNAENPLANLEKFTIADLQAADARAVAAGDAAGHQCYPVLIGVIQSAQAKAGSAKPTGPIDLFEAGRILAMQGPQSVSGVAQQVNLGCAALFIDANMTLARLGLMVGITVPKIP